MNIGTIPVSPYNPSVFVDNSTHNAFLKNFTMNWFNTCVCSVSPPPPISVVLCSTVLQGFCEINFEIPLMHYLDWLFVKTNGLLRQMNNGGLEFNE